MTSKTPNELLEIISLAVAPLTPPGFQAKVILMPDNLLDTPTIKEAKEIRLLACEFFGKTEEYILTRGRKFEVVIIRKMLCKLLRKHTTLSLQKIASIVGYGDDHSCVCRGIEALESLMFTEKEFSEQYANLEEFIKINLDHSHKKAS
jgi:chromosomal replication initiation ATPase DnaA